MHPLTRRQILQRSGAGFGALALQSLLGADGVLSAGLDRALGAAVAAWLFTAHATGVLIASRTHFLQVLEGKFEEVNAIFRRICRDPRHTEMSIISFSVIDYQLFDGWGMRGIGAFDFNKALDAAHAAAERQSGGAVAEKR